MELKFGILSTSSIAPRFIAAVRQAKAGEIVALSSRSEEKALKKADEWDIPVAYGSHEELLRDENVNIVYISTVNSLHFVWAKAALEAGKHVVCEKPCTTDPEQTRELFRIAREKNLFFMEAQKMLFLPAVLEVKRSIAAGELGRIRQVETTHCFSPSYNTWIYDPEAGGGPLLSSGIYAMELLIWLFGGISQIGGYANILQNGVEWQYCLTGMTENGIPFTVKNSTAAVMPNVARICGTKGYVEIPEYWKARKAVFHIGDTCRTAEYPCEYELFYEAEHIAACFREGLRSSPVVTEELSVRGIAALQQAKENWIAIEKEP